LPKLEEPDRGSPEPQRVREKVTQQARVARPYTSGCCGSGEPRSGGQPACGHNAHRQRLVLL